MSSTVLEHPSTPFNLDYWRTENLQAGWTRVIDEKLIEWGLHPDQFGDEIDAPTNLAITAAAQTAINLFQSGASVPDWVVPTGDGGIAFRWGEAGKSLLSLEFDVAGRTRLFGSVGGKVVLERVG